MENTPKRTFQLEERRIGAKYVAVTDGGEFRQNLASEILPAVMAA